MNKAGDAFKTRFQQLIRRTAQQRVTETPPRAEESKKNKRRKPSQIRKSVVSSGPAYFRRSRLFQNKGKHNICVRERA